MPKNVGIDISSFQSSWPGDDLFVVHKATEGHDYQDPHFAQRFPQIIANPTYGLAGAYHYARPGDGFDGTAQAEFFAVTALAAGFRKDVDIWQLDCETGGNENVTATEWFVFIPAFMQKATELLGARGFMYAGWPFLEALQLQPLVAHYNWWLPDYEVNDGNLHPVQTPPAVSAFIVLHQYTSYPIDKNAVQNWPRWNEIVGVDWAALQKIADFVHAVTETPLKLGDRGPLVEQLNELLFHNGSPECVLGDAYGVETQHEVMKYKIEYGVSNRNGSYAGRTIVTALFKHAK